MQSKPVSNALVFTILITISILLLNNNVFATEEQLLFDHPSKAPVPPPVKLPTKPPTSPIVKKYTAVEGVVYCKACKYKGVETLLGASPLAGAQVTLECKNNKYKPVRVKSKTDKNGYFFIKLLKSTMFYGPGSCTATLLSSPSKKCSSPTNLNDGITGANLLVDWESVTNTTFPYVLYNVGPFAFEPTKTVKCY